MSKSNIISNPDHWVDHYSDSLFGFALTRIRNREAAENLVQETFLAALQAKEHFSGKSSEKTWLIGIMKHKIIDYFRHKYREIPATDLQTEEQAINAFFDRSEHFKKQPTHWSPQPREIVENGEFWKTFEKCLQKLPAQTAQAFTLREIDRIDHKKICKVLNISSTNLWVMLHRARLQLRHCLESNWFESYGPFLH